jgi:hypothetical protein
MQSHLRSALPLIASITLLFTAGIGSPAAASAAGARAPAPRMMAVTIHITSTSGTVWGTVAARYTYHKATTRRSCAAASCTLHIPKGVTAHLSQTATDSTTWPFQNWQVARNGHTSTMSGASIAVKVTGKLSVTAVYVLSSGSSSGGYSSGGYNGGYGG